LLVFTDINDIPEYIDGTGEIAAAVIG